MVCGRSGYQRSRETQCGKAWAPDDPIVAAAEERVDGTRLGMLRTLLMDCGCAEQTVQIRCLPLLGAGDTLLSVPLEQLRVLCRRALA
ncbi:hypothetical protein ACW2Q0_17270 [Nocardia sp. R16R-3T]